MKDYHKLVQLNKDLYHDNLVLKQNFDIANSHATLMAKTITLILEKYVDEEKREEVKKEFLEQAAKELMEARNGKEKKANK